MLIAGAAGSGKSVIAGHVTDLARRAGWTILVLAVDRLPDADTTYGLGGQMQRRMICDKVKPDRFADNEKLVKAVHVPSRRRTRRRDRGVRNTTGGVAAVRGG